MIENKQSIYDLVIIINSILGFLKGWEIQYSPKGKDNLKYAGRNPTKIFSVIGNKDRGKSFILSKILKINLPSGYSVATKGLSISFLNKKPSNVALIDSVGFESPLLECDGNDYLLKSDDEQKNKKVYEELAELSEQIKRLKEKKEEARDIIDKENEFFRIRNEFRKGLKNKDEQIYSLTNERRITDFFLQRFIIENANVLLLVVGKLTIDDQLFLNKLTKLIKENQEKFLQKIIVIHNLMKMKKISVVEQYIENTLLKSLTFTLKEEEDLYLKEREKKGIDYNKYCYYEVSEDPNDKEITHLIMAQEGTEAGDYYNESAIEFIRSFGKTVVDAEPFKFIEKLKDYFCKVSETILKFEKTKGNITKKDSEESYEKITPQNIELIPLKENVDKLKLNYENSINLETFYGDNLITDTFGDPKFTPKYYVVSNDPDYVKIYLDCPGKTTINNIIVKFPDEPHQQQFSTVIISGKREKQKNKTLGKKFGSGEFELKIYLRNKDGDITKDYTKENIDNGFCLIKLKREDA